MAYTVPPMHEYGCAKLLAVAQQAVQEADYAHQEHAAFKARVAALLNRIETSGTYCPDCMGDKCYGSTDWLDHRPDCELAALLKEAQE